MNTEQFKKLLLIAFNKNPMADLAVMLMGVGFDQEWLEDRLNECPDVSEFIKQDIRDEFILNYKP
jgi:hypothetical protein